MLPLNLDTLFCELIGQKALSGTVSTFQYCSKRFLEVHPGLFRF